MIEFLKHNWETLTVSVGSILAIFGGIKLKKSGEKEAEGNALKTMQTAYDSFVLDSKEKYVELKEMQLDLKVELKESRSEISILKLEINTLQKRNEMLQNEVDNWVIKYTKLKKDFELYKKNQAL